MIERIADLWIGRRARPNAAALAAVRNLAACIVITGASRGIGFELARAFARDCKPLLIIARTPAPLEVAAKTLREEDDLAVHALALDVTAADAAARIDAALRAHGLYCDVLINNAGLGLSGDFANQASEDLDRLIAVNIAALTRLTHHFLEPMLGRSAGGVLNVASLGGLMPGPYQAAYYASKAYVISLTEALGSECAGRGVRIAALASGPVETTFHAAMGAETALYRKILPAISAERAARSARLGFRLGRRMIVPGILYAIAAILSRLLPRPVLAALVGVLLKPRD